MDISLVSWLVLYLIVTSTALPTQASTTLQSTQTSASPSTPCPQGWPQCGSHCYKLVVWNAGVDYWNAVATCTGQGGWIARPKTQDETWWILRNASIFQAYWVDLHWNSGANDWVWGDGEKYSAVANKTQMSAIATQNNCNKGYCLFNDAGSLETDFCNRSKPVVCQRDAVITTTALPTTTPVKATSASVTTAVSTASSVTTATSQATTQATFQATTGQTVTPSTAAASTPLVTSTCFCPVCLSPTVPSTTGSLGGTQPQTSQSTATTAQSTQTTIGTQAATSASSTTAQQAVPTTQSNATQRSNYSHQLEEELEIAAQGEASAVTPGDIMFARASGVVAITVMVCFPCLIIALDLSKVISCAKKTVQRRATRIQKISSSDYYKQSSSTSVPKKLTQTVMPTPVALPLRPIRTLEPRPPLISGKLEIGEGSARVLVSPRPPAPRHRRWVNVLVFMNRLMLLVRRRREEEADPPQPAEETCEIEDVQDTPLQ